MLERLKKEADSIGKPAWRPMLAYQAALHERSICPAHPPLPYQWESLGLGYHGGHAFGNWDLVHCVLDVMPPEPEHARRQLLNNLSIQEPNGLLLGVIYLRDGKFIWTPNVSHPPLWVVAVQDYCDTTGNDDLLPAAYEVATRQLQWFERERKPAGLGFYYCDITRSRWESGVDEGVRFDSPAEVPFACVDATAHLYTVCESLARWAEKLARDGSQWERRANDLRSFMQNELFDRDTGFFYDRRAIVEPRVRALSFEGMWPMVVGAATADQAARVINEHLLNPKRFLAPYPITTVSMDDARFELRMWRGPVWQSMTYWAARGCLRYGRRDAARILMERALDGCAHEYEATGTIWEFHHPYLGSPTELKRKAKTYANVPCRDYLGHNPVFAMARLWETTADQLDYSASKGRMNDGIPCTAAR